MPRRVGSGSDHDPGIYVVWIESLHHLPESDPPQTPSQGRHGLGHLIERLLNSAFHIIGLSERATPLRHSSFAVTRLFAFPSVRTD